MLGSNGAAEEEKDRGVVADVARVGEQARVFHPRAPGEDSGRGGSPETEIDDELEVDSALGLAAGGGSLRPEGGDGRGARRGEEPLLGPRLSADEHRGASHGPRRPGRHGGAHRRLGSKRERGAEGRGRRRKACEGQDADTAHFQNTDLPRIRPLFLKWMLAGERLKISTTRLYQSARIETLTCFEISLVQKSF